MTHEAQQQLDFTTRTARLRLLRCVKLPKLEGTRPATMLGVLQAIDDKAGEKAQWRMRVDDIKQATGHKHRAAVDRAIAGLQQLGLLRVARTAYGAWYAIEWENLAQLRPQNGVESSRGQGRESAQRELQTPRSAYRESAQRELQTPRSAYRESALRELQEPAPLLPQEPPPPAPTWEEVACKLRDEEGMARAADCVKAARQRGESPGDVLALIDEYREGLRVGRFEKQGALWQRLVFGVWPEAGEAHKRAEKLAWREKSDAAKAAERQTEIEAAAVDRRREAEGESRYGPTIDALSSDEIASLLGDNRVLLALAVKHRRDAGSNPLIRGQLVRALSARDDGCAAKCDADDDCAALAAEHAHSPEGETFAARAAGR